MVGFLDNCDFNATSTGTGNFVVTIAVQGRQTPVSAGAVDAEIYRYYARSSDLSQWEEGFGAYTVSSTTLARTTVVSNSSGTTSLISFSTVPLVAIVAGKRDLAALNDLKNVTFAVSASAGALTIALKDGAGNDATAAAPIPIVFRNVSPTASPNIPTVLEVLAASSVVVPSTSTCGTISATGCRLWITGWNDGGTFRLGVFNASTANNIYALNEASLASSLQVVAAGNAAGQHYTAGAAVTSKAFRILGYVDWNASGVATAGTWTTTNLNEIQTFGPGIPRPGTPTGTISQSPTTTTDTGTTSTTYAASAFMGSITPSSAANAVRASAFIVAVQSGTNNVSAKLQRGTLWTGASAIFVNNGTTGAGAAGVSCGIDFPNSTASTTYTVYRRTNNAATTVMCPSINSATEPAVILLEEIMG